jgi:hypothetical protein
MIMNILKAVAGTGKPSWGNQYVRGHTIGIPELSFHELFVRADI